MATAQPKVQNYKNHRNFAYGNYLSTMVMAGATALAGVHLYHHHSVTNALWVVVALAAVYVAYRTRANALKVQDRLIRLEERLRLEKVLSSGLKSRIGELSVKQLVALRFADDSEVEALVQKALGGMDGEALKKEIKAWRADWHRV